MLTPLDILLYVLFGVDEQNLELHSRPEPRCPDQTQPSDALTRSQANVSIVMLEGVRLQLPALG